MLNKVKEAIFGKNPGMTRGELRAMSERSRMSKYFQYLAYDSDTKLYLNKDDTLGFLWECSALSFAGEKSLDTLKGVFRSGLPMGSIVQFILYADKHIEPLIQAYEQLKVRKDPLVARATEELCAYMRRGVNGVESCAGIPLRNFRLLVSVKIPVPKTKEDHSRLNLKDLYSNFSEVLKGAHLSPTDMTPPQLIDMMRRVLNDRDFPSGPAPYDDTVPISDQLLLAESVIEKGMSQMHVGGRTFRCVTPKSYPAEVDPLQTNELFGGIWGVISDADQIKTPFLFTFNIIIHDLKMKLHNKCDLVLYQKAAGSFAPRLMRKQTEYMQAVDALDKGEAFVKVLPIMWTWGVTDAQVGDSVSRIKRIWESQGYVMQEDKGILPLLFMSAMPFGLIDQEKNIENLDRDFIVPADTATTVMPIQGDYAGGGMPQMIYMGRKGQVCTLDIFDKNANNHNLFIVASSGAGKSFLVNNIAYNYYAANSLIRLIDIGGSYKKMTKMFDARYMDFTEDSNICINPFSGITDINNDVSVIASVVLQMIYSVTDKMPDDIAETGATLIKEAIMWAFNQDGTEADIDDVHQYLKMYPQYSTELSSDERPSAAYEQFKTIAHTMAFNLTEFTSRGTYGRWFNGKSNFNIASDEFVVLELEHLKPRKELFKVVTMQILNAVTQDLYLSDRSRRRLVIFDEAWQFLGGENKNMKDVIESGYRRARKYGGSFCIISQSLLDLKGFGSIGDVIRANSAYKFYLESNDFEKARQEKLLDCDDFTLKLLKTVRSVRPKYSEIYQETPYGTGVVRLSVDPFSYYMYTSDSKEIAEIDKLVDGGISYDKAIQEMVRKYRS